MSRRVCPACDAAEARFWRAKNDCLRWRCRQCGAVFAPAPARDGGEFYDYGLYYYERARFETASPGGGVARASGRPGGRPGGAVPADRAGRFAEGAFDVVTMIELQEHAPEPRRLLGEAGRRLRPRGLLYLTTPNAQSLNRWLLGSRWTAFSPPEHLILWTVPAIRRALAETGPVRVRIHTEAFNLTELLARFRWPGRPGAPVDRNAAAQALNAAFSSSPLRGALKGLIKRGLSLARAGDTGLVALQETGGRASAWRARATH